MKSLQDQSVLVLGLGASGYAMARWAARCGARVTVADTRAEPPQLAALREHVPAAQFVSGAFGASLLQEGVQAVFRSPGLSPAQVATVLAAAQERGIRSSGELGLFAEALADLKAQQAYAPAVLAITGTNGKTTVTALTGQLVERAGKRTAVAGNIGPTLLETLADKLDSGELPEVWVIELSSFQLEGVDNFEPTAAAVLNVTQDHLDWHGTMQAYAAAKARIFGSNALMVLNREDALVMQMLPAPVRTSAARLPVGASAPLGGSETALAASVGVKKFRGKMEQREHITFGAAMPTRPGDFGIEVVNGMAWLVRALEADETRRKRSDEAEEIHIQRLMPADALRIRGRHNAVNALAALALAGAAGCPLGPMLYGLRDYRGEPHRVESVGIVNQVEYFDDSKGTNVGATVAALRGLGEAASEPGTAGSQRKLVVILGGEGKGQDFSPLAAPVARHARAAVLIGRDAPLIRAVLEPAGVTLLDAGSMEQAVSLATERAHAGDAVLMSPACASFDMFRNYPHRAEVFRAAVQAIADAAGVQLGGQS
jgi:UDP-N-acetylmuramoylalanine--D-glutamate ligase